MAKSSPEHQFEVREIQTKEEYARLVDVLWTANFQPYKYLPPFLMHTLPANLTFTTRPQSYLHSRPSRNRAHSCGQKSRQST